jgi:hypothetical protein
VIDAAALHRAADRVGDEAGTPAMDALAAAGAEFIHESVLSDEFGVEFLVDTRSLGYGIMLGYLAATPVDYMRESRIARARGLAQAISECRDDARLAGVREGAAEIFQLLGGEG